MILNFVPRALVLCTIALFSTSVFAQVSDVRQQPNKQVAQIGEPTFSISDDPIIISTAEAGTVRVAEPISSSNLLTSSSLGLARLQPMLAAAIEDRLGSPYRWGSQGPNLFDCSGFVWSSYHSIGIDFERGSARTLWTRFEAPAPEDNFKYGNLVFFSHQTHVGIVADENGFYHASRHHGVVYAPFNDYWKRHIDGFRRPPVAVQQPQSVASHKVIAGQ